MRIFGFSQKETGARGLPWRQHSMCNSFFSNVNFGCNCEEHYSNISGDILDLLSSFA